MSGQPERWALVETPDPDVVSSWHIQAGEMRLPLFPYKRVYSEDRTQSGLVRDEEAFRIARLAVCAPELLEALQACERRLTHLACASVPVLAELKQARAVIAKATATP